ncbi:hypothetical protein GEMRC1_013376 [Eukaryota sp. GEM-RC1]
MARDFLIIPAASIPCERVFSVAGHINSKKRPSLADESLTSLMLLKDWLNYGCELVDCSDDENDEYDPSLDSLDLKVLINFCPIRTAVFDEFLQ